MVIIAAVDREGPHNKLLHEAEKLAQAFDEELHIVHVLSQKEFRQIETDHVDSKGEAVSPKEIKAYAESKVAEIADGVVEEYVAVGRIGIVDEEVLEYAEEIDASYIVIGGRQRSPIGKALFGSEAQSILLSAPCPVVFSESGN
ncbi:universal stress protein [Natronocalculus amylovorans]|uniref:Universal stress protein n=1 Tax=Natronocalculus amylovorans TaxID=2917812 RepID=A0AAE3KA67_9EURY|nr:universal stress protein [Natronocalculus amylovorans]MCL9818140.1 universal stress protein [Natronocalculus amylovorans]NUE03862.1 universal stress protein [Halorubraceae archaeon YAN]